MVLPRAPKGTPGYLVASAKGSGGQDGSRTSSHRPYRFGSGAVGLRMQGSLIRPWYCHRVSRLYGTSRVVGGDESVLRKSREPKLAVASVSQRRSLPPLQMSQVIRPAASSGISEMPPSMSLK